MGFAAAASGSCGRLFAPWLSRRVCRPCSMFSRMLLLISTRSGSGTDTVAPTGQSEPLLASTRTWAVAPDSGSPLSWIASPSRIWHGPLAVFSTSSGSEARNRWGPLPANEGGKLSVGGDGGSLAWTSASDCASASCLRTSSAIMSFTSSDIGADPSSDSSGAAPGSSLFARYAA